MTKKTARCVCWGLLLLLGVATPLPAQDASWAEKMFDKLEHNFGVVARGADTRYRLTITNRYVETIHISNVRTSCGCTAAKPSQDTLRSRETAYLEITMDTRKFTHQKDSAVTVVFDQPTYAEVRIPVHVYIRTDVVLTPGAVEFGAVPTGAEQTRNIAVSYAGRQNWTVRDVISKNPNLNVKIKETGRADGRVNYDLQVSLKSGTPVGVLRDQVTLVTDDASNPYIPVLVEARVEAEFTVSPQVVSFGVLKPGQKKTVNVVIRGKKPFSIEKIESEKAAGTFEVRLPKDSKIIHVLPLTMVAPETPGTVDELFTVTIPGSEEGAAFRVYGKVEAPASVQTSGPTSTSAAKVAPE